ncbi:hypothetical protein [Neobacillus drentensis]|uniref:hypothetical protein n=1 Tax=Neobacillus drentensis TaxID=220684 RepID=UPI0030001D0A
MKKLSFFSLFLLLFVSGCAGNQGAQGNQKAYDLRSDNSAHNNMSIQGNNDRDTSMNMSNRGKNKQHMVEDDITNQNPNFLDLKGTGSGSEAGGAKNTGQDIAKAKHVIAASDEFETDNVWINGDRMWVTVYKKGKQSDQGKNKAEARLHRKLVQALPRYDIEVRVKENRR